MHRTRFIVKAIVAELLWITAVSAAPAITPQSRLICACSRTRRTAVGLQGGDRTLHHDHAQQDAGKAGQGQGKKPDAVNGCSEAAAWRSSIGQEVLHISQIGKLTASKGMP